MEAKLDHLARSSCPHFTDTADFASYMAIHDEDVGSSDYVSTVPAVNVEFGDTKGNCAQDRHPKARDQLTTWMAQMALRQDWIWVEAKRNWIPHRRRNRRTHADPASMDRWHHTATTQTWDIPDTTAGTNNTDLGPNTGHGL